MAYLYGFTRPLVWGLRDLVSRGALSLEAARSLEASLIVATRVLGGLCVVAIGCWWPLSVLGPVMAGLVALVFGSGCIMVWIFGNRRFRASLTVGGYGPDRLR